MGWVAPLLLRPRTDDGHAGAGVLDPDSPSQQDFCGVSLAASPKHAEVDSCGTAAAVIRSSIPDRTLAALTEIAVQQRSHGASCDVVDLEGRGLRLGQVEA